jgi:hypothetical protein
VVFVTCNELSLIDGRANPAQTQNLHQPTLQVAVGCYVKANAHARDEKTIPTSRLCFAVPGWSFSKSVMDCGSVPMEVLREVLGPSLLHKEGISGLLQLW